MANFQAKSKQSEAKSNLKGIATAEKAFFAEKNKYSANMLAIGFRPEGQTRYAYSLGTGTPELPSNKIDNSKAVDCWLAENDNNAAGTTCHQPDKMGFKAATGSEAATLTAPGVLGTATASQFVASAAGNVDSDVLNDGWIINSANMTMSEGVCNHDYTSGAEQGNSVVSSLTPINTVDDVAFDECS